MLSYIFKLYNWRKSNFLNKPPIALPDSLHMSISTMHVLNTKHQRKMGKIIFSRYLMYIFSAVLVICLYYYVARILYQQEKQLAYLYHYYDHMIRWYHRFRAVSHNKTSYIICDVICVVVINRTLYGAILNKFHCFFSIK